MTGVAPKDYASARRAERVRSALASQASVTEAIYDAGYNANSRFYEEAPQQLGMRPGQYRDGGQGTSIRFAVGECSLGAILVAATAKGVCAISSATIPISSPATFRTSFRRPSWSAPIREFEATIAQVVGLVDDPGHAIDLLLDIRGTVFQRRVWDALRRIPAGKTMSYAEIAAAIGEPGAARAVARACGANRLAVAIPCHRVVRSDGALSGYRWASSASARFSIASARRPDGPL